MPHSPSVYPPALSVQHHTDICDNYNQVNILLHHVGLTILSLVVAKALSFLLTAVNGSMTHLATHLAAPLDALGKGFIHETHVPVLFLALLFLGLRL